jgi:hypothetical protein
MRDRLFDALPDCHPATRSQQHIFRNNQNHIDFLQRLIYVNILPLLSCVFEL